MVSPETIEVNQRFVWEHERGELQEVSVLENDRRNRELVVVHGGQDAPPYGRISRVPYSKILFIGSIEEAYRAERAALDWVLRNCQVTYQDLHFPIPVRSRASVAYVMGLRATRHAEPAREVEVTAETLPSSGTQVNPGPGSS